MESTFNDMGSFAAEVERVFRASKDFIVPSYKLALEKGNILVVDQKEQYPLNDYADGQLAQKLGIPKNYWDKCLEIEGLRDINANMWFLNSTQGRMVRTIDGKARAILSDRFARIDNFPVLEAIYPVLEEANQKYGLQIVSQALSETKMYLQIVFPKRVGEIRVGDVVQGGIVFRNSEVGAGRYDISYFTRRLKCLNGMVGESIIRKNHVGRRMDSDEEGEGIFKADTLASELNTIALKSRDALEEAIHSDWFEREFLRMKDSAVDAIVRPVETVEKAVKVLQLPDYSKDLLVNNLIKEGDLSRWGLANAVTALAHDDKFREPDKAFSVEVAGRELISMSKKDWASLTA